MFYRDAEKYKTYKSELISLIKLRRRSLRKAMASKVIKSGTTNITEDKYDITCLEKELEFSRPTKSKDMQYRKRQYCNFPKLIKDFVPDDLPLRFHGCPIYIARDILQSGWLSSPKDRLEFGKPADIQGHFYVTTKNNIRYTIASYMDSFAKHIPAGCVFVLLPKDENDIKFVEPYCIISNVNFREEPVRLFAVITTPENIERVKEWAVAGGVDPTKVHDFDSFIKLFDRNINQNQPVASTPPPKPLGTAR